MEEQPDLIVPPVTSRTVRRFSGDNLAHWAWTEPSVWTNSMLATLEQSSVRGGKWQSLIDKVYEPDNLYSAFREVAAHKGAPSVDNITIEDFTAALDRTVTKLEHQLRDGAYTPQSIKRVHIPKPGTNETRPLAPLWMNTGRRCEIASCRTHFAMCWSRYLNGSSRNTATAFVPIEDVKTRCVAWIV